MGNSDLAHGELPRGVNKYELLEPRIVLDVTQVILQYVLEGVAAIGIWPIIKHSWVGRRALIIAFFRVIDVAIEPAPCKFVVALFLLNAHSLIGVVFATLSPVS